MDCVNRVCKLIETNKIDELEEDLLEKLSKHKDTIFPVEFWPSIENYGKKTYLSPLHVINEICSPKLSKETRSSIQNYMGNMKIKVWEDKNFQQMVRKGIIILRAGRF